MSERSEINKANILNPSRLLVDRCGSLLEVKFAIPTPWALLCWLRMEVTALSTVIVTGAP